MAKEFGTVWKASWRQIEVAGIYVLQIFLLSLVKVLKNTSFGQKQVESFLAEAELMKGMNSHKVQFNFLALNCTECSSSVRSLRKATLYCNVSLSLVLNFLHMLVNIVKKEVYWGFCKIQHFH
jgi:hypothetical protein